jgi:oxygen-dependent protoporphyrinogen oxidase
MAPPGRDVDVVVVGAGLAGLTAAWRLRDLDVLVLEASDRAGGRIKSERRGDVWLNFGAHVFSGPDSASGRLIDELGLAVRSVPGSLTAVALDGRIVTSGPVETYPFRLSLSLRERYALARAGLKLRFAVKRYGQVARARPGETPAQRQLRILQFHDDQSFTDFIGPLPAKVGAILRSTLTRSSGEPEALAAGYGIGYFHLVWNGSEGLGRNLLGGSGTLTDALARGLGAPRIRLASPVRSVARDGDGVIVRYGPEGRESTVTARSTVVATPAPVTVELVPELPAHQRDALRSIEYGPYVVGAFLTREQAPMPWDGVYALATPQCSFSMLFNTANVLRTDGARAPGGSLMVYAAANLARELSDLADDAVAERFLADLSGLYPQARTVVSEVVIQRWSRGLPFAMVGRGRLQPSLTAPSPPVHLAGDYLGSLYTETAVHSAETAAASVREQFGVGLPAVART